MVSERLMRVVAGLIGLIVIVIVLGLLFIYSGIFDVAATNPDSKPVAWVLGTTMENSVKRHARGIKARALNDPAMIRAGFGHYKDDCVMCHGAPGIGLGEVGRGLTPPPPRLTKTANDWKTRELFWITKHGIRMTGMPAWGKIDSDDELWETVSFVRRLPKMSPAQYKSMGAEVGGD